ncbi:MAG: response regulator [Anaerolineales bacterium]|nr:MAG: response regulator [Anaerolineales bacterium]
MSRVLVVDDEEAYRSLMAGHLERKGFEVEKASDGKQALARLQESSFDVLVTDLMMPKMSGLDLLRQAKKLDPWLEVIVITASGQVGNAISAMREDGAFDYLLKPLETIGELSLAVGRAAQHRNLRFDRDRLNDQLTAEASRLQALMTHTGEAIISVDQTGTISVANPSAVHLLGRSDLIGSIAHEVLPKALVDLLDGWHMMGDSEPTVVELNWTDDALQLVSLASIAEGGNGGRGWVMVCRDITHLKNLDELKMRMLTEAAGKIRLPLAQAVSRLAELGEASEISNEDRSATIYQLAKLLGRIQSWMDELLSLVRVEAGIGYQTGEVAFAEVANQDLQARFDELNKERNLNLVLEIEDDLPEIRVEKGVFERILQGLISRAAARSSRGGSVRVSGRRHQDLVWIEVTDEGLQKQKSNTMEDDEFEGAEYLQELEGFGLEMVKAIVNRMGGQVWVKGQGAVGSTIAISLPIAEGERELA